MCDLSKKNRLMGKATYHRVVQLLPVKYVVVTLPCAGGTLFLIGSFDFWPGLELEAINAGAWCFLTGSICYWIAPFLDYWELTHNLDNLVDRPLDMPTDVTSPRHARSAFSAALYEQLYKAHVLRLQRVNALIYAAGGAFFVGGSCLFFPAMEDLIMHGGWLYITGCILVLVAALLGALTAHEMRKTAAIRDGWSDEGLTVLSCTLYVLGNALYITGSVWCRTYFPSSLGSLSAPLGSCVCVRAWLVRNAKPHTLPSRHRSQRGARGGGRCCSSRASSKRAGRPFAWRPFGSSCSARYSSSQARSSTCWWCYAKPPPTGAAATTDWATSPSRWRCGRRAGGPAGREY